MPNDENVEDINLKKSRIAAARFINLYNEIIELHADVVNTETGHIFVKNVLLNATAFLVTALTSFFQLENPEPFIDDFFARSKAMVMALRDDLSKLEEKEND